jgi:predicted secreted hydrolase
VSDIDNKKHHCFQRNSRQGIGQAGARSESCEVWNGDWKAWLVDESHRLRANDDDVDIDLALVPTKPPALHGNQGLSQKGPTAGNASHYYSLTRMNTTGTVSIGRESFTVQGQSWMDHEFSTSFLEPGQLGWDWLAIQLEDGIDLMLYRMRREGGRIDAFSSGSVIDKSGKVVHLHSGEYAMIPQRTWKSPETGAEYPLHWDIQIPSLGYRFTIRPTFSAQEMTTEDTTGISYWEGAILVSGESGDQPICGRGYMELTGYIGQGLGSLIE